MLRPLYTNGAFPTADQGGGGCRRRGRGPSRGSRQDQQVQPATPEGAQDRGRAQGQKRESGPCDQCEDVFADSSRPLLQKEKEELDDITMELELADEDDLIPYVAENSTRRHQ